MVRPRHSWRLTLPELITVVAVIALVFAYMPELQASLFAIGIIASTAIDAST